MILLPEQMQRLSDMGALMEQRLPLPTIRTPGKQASSSGGGDVETQGRQRARWRNAGSPTGFGAGHCPPCV